MIPRSAAKHKQACAIACVHSLPALNAHHSPSWTGSPVNQFHAKMTDQCERQACHYGLSSIRACPAAFDAPDLSPMCHSDENSVFRHPRTTQDRFRRGALSDSWAVSFRRLTHATLGPAR